MRQLELLSVRFMIKAVLFIGTALIFFSCSNDNETKGLGEINRNFANRTILHANVIYKDSGKIALELKTPLIEEYSFIDSPYTIMKKGLNLKFWSKNNPKPNFLKANWAKINDVKKTYEGQGNVVMINNDGDTLRTEHIFWDRYTRRITTKDTVIITRLDGTKIISNQGLEGAEDFKEFTFYQNHGVINAEEKEKKTKDTLTESIKQEAFLDKKTLSLEPKQQEPQ